jgi:hypothetical protein
MADVTSKAAIDPVAAATNARATSLRGADVKRCMKRSLFLTF